ncbi:MAG: site-2 protease family protein [Candidatus Liptonbacteria bacterium]|nr:site-2 protease family protein [Candidatus Liptonbacteria bacterium]
METVLSYAIPIIVVLGVLIGFHEFGHFVFAKLMGVEVLKFSIGFGPRIISKKIGETEYLLSLVPLGGYVKMAGEDSSEQEDGVDGEKIPSKRTFGGKRFWQKFLIVLAGSGFNLLLGFCALFASSVFYGKVVLTNVVDEVMPDTPVTQADTLSGDKVADIAVPHPVKMRSHENLIKKAFVETYNYAALILLAIPKMFSGAISVKELGGPIMIGKLAHDAWQINGLESFLEFTAFLSINLAVLNSLPIPALDGGYLWIFLPFEALMGRPMRKRPREILQKTGLFLLLALMSFTILNDISRWITW